MSDNPDFGCPYGPDPMQEAYDSGKQAGAQAERERLLKVVGDVAEDLGGCCTNRERFLAELKQRLEGE